MSKTPEIVDVLEAVKEFRNNFQIVVRKNDETVNPVAPITAVFPINVSWIEKLLTERGFCCYEGLVEQQLVTFDAKYDNTLIDDQWRINMGTLENLLPVLRRKRKIERAQIWFYRTAAVSAAVTALSAAASALAFLLK